MLKTNGSVAAREEYTNEVGSIVMVPMRNFADRVPVGVATFSITYRFAGVHQPGIARPLPTQEDDSRVHDLEKQVETLMTLLTAR